MKLIRIAPRLDIKGPNLVKGVNLEGLRVLGTPEIFAKYYYENGADEIIFQDVVASLFERNSLNEIIKNTAKDVFIPITVGGGIRNLNDIQEVLRSGADKVSINTAAIKNPKFIEEAAKYFGSSTIVVSIEAIKSHNGSYYAFFDNGREETGVEVISWAKRVTDLGAGEISITSVDKEGTGSGYDLELLQKLRNCTSIPITSHGGAGDIPNIIEATKYCNALSIASALHYKIYQKLNKRNFNEHEGNISFLKKRSSEENRKTFFIVDLKKELHKNHINHRPAYE